MSDTGEVRRDDRPYSGLAYVFREDGALDRIEAVSDGKLAGRSEDWIELPGGGVRVDDEALDEEEDYGPLLWQGQPVDGVVYAFDEAGFCEAEEIYLGGGSTSLGGRTWYRSGAARQAYTMDEGSAWLEDGRLVTRRVGAEMTLNLVFETGKVGAIILRDPGLLDMTIVTDLGVATSLLLVGNAIDGALLTRLKQVAIYAELQKLHLIETSITTGDLVGLADMPDLTRLDLDANPNTSADDRDALAAALPNCDIRFL